jgi:hypothetical protein
MLVCVILFFSLFSLFDHIHIYPCSKQKTPVLHHYYAHPIKMEFFVGPEFFYVSLIGLLEDSKATLMPVMILLYTHTLTNYNTPTFLD